MFGEFGYRPARRQQCFDLIDRVGDAALQQAARGPAAKRRDDNC